MLGFEANGGSLIVDDPLFARYGAVEEVAGIYLYAGFVGEHFHHDARIGVAQTDSGAARVACRVEYPVVVVSVTVFDLFVVGGDVCADGFGFAEVEGSTGHSVD